MEIKVVSKSKMATNKEHRNYSNLRMQKKHESDFHLPDLMNARQESNNSMLISDLPDPVSRNVTVL